MYTGNIDVLVAAYNQRGHIVDYGGLQVLAPSFSVQSGETISWRIASQTFFSLAVLRAGGKKQAIALPSSFYNTLPELPATEPTDSDMAWLVYDLQYEAVIDQYVIRLHKTVHTKFDSIIGLLTPGDIHWPEAGNEQKFVNHLYTRMEQDAVT